MNRQEVHDTIKEKFLQRGDCLVLLIIEEK